jgi:transcription elongation factor GreA
MNDPEIVSESAGGLLLTPEGYHALQTELEHLTMVKRPEIADRIRESLQHGEFSEDNQELGEVKFEQAMVESRMAELKGIFGSAQILDPALIPIDHVGVGSLVKVSDMDLDDEFEIRVVASVEADPNRDLLSNESPMGTSMMGHQVGDIFEFDAPDGRKRYKIIGIRR